MPLTEEQNQFVSSAKEHVDILGIARAGTGKTTTGVAVCSALRPERVLYIAFAKVNAQDIQQRAPANTEGRTTHSYGFSVVTKNVRGARYDKFKTANLVQRVLPRAAKRDTVNTLAHLVSMGKAWLATDVETMAALAGRYDDTVPTNDKAVARMSLVDWCEEALGVMEACRKDERSLDYDDMIYLPAVHDYRHEQYGRVILDEAQDITPAQEALVLKARGLNGRLMTVGDDRQAIYAWRGADPQAMFRMAKLFGSRELKITATFRCGRAIVEDAKRFVPDYVGAAAHEGMVASAGEEDLMKGARPGDAILSRVNAPLAQLCLKFLRNGQRAAIRGKDIGSGLSKLVRQSDASNIEELAAWLEQYRERENLRLTAAGREDEIEAVSDRIETIHALADGCANIADLTSRFESLFSDADGENGQKDTSRILLSSTHRAKGLEWDRVWMLDATYRPAVDGGHAPVCEENNLVYVAITRAKNELFHVQGVGAPKKRKR